MFKKEAWNFLRDRATGYASVESGRLIGFGAFVTAVLFTGWQVVTKGQFSITDYCQGMGILGAGNGIGIATKTVAQAFYAKAALPKEGENIG